MRSRNSQRGITLISLLAIIVLISFAALIVVRIAPSYFTYYTIVSIAESVHDDPELRNGSPHDVRQALNTRMRINDVEGQGYDVIRPQQKNGEWTFAIDYEDRRPLIGNIDVVMRYHRRIGS